MINELTCEIEKNAASSIHVYYKNIFELKNRITNLKFGDANIKQIDENGTLSLWMYEAPYYVPKFEMIFYDGLGYTHA